MIIGFIIGIYLEILTAKQIGIYSIMLMLVGFCGAYFDKNFSKEGKITILFMVSGATIVFETVIYLYTCFKNALPMQMAGFIEILLIEVVFNVLLTIILYPFIRNSGYFLEEVFKKNKILTRYF